MRAPGHSPTLFRSLFRGRSPARVAALAAAAASAAAFLTQAAPAGAATLPSPARAVEVAQPPGAHSPSSAELLGVACTAPGDCVAAGGSQAGNGGYQPMVATQSGGNWSAGVALRLPPDAQAQPYATASGIACPRAGECVTVGSYAAVGHATQAFIATEKGGAWGRAATPALPANAATPSSAALDAVACAPSGACTALGTYTDVHGDEQAMAVSSTPAGPWGRATEIAAPAGASADPATFLTGIACARAYCVAVGDVNTGGAQVRQAVGAVETHGAWGPAALVTAPANQSPGTLAEISSVSCVRQRCVGVGSYVAGGLQRAMSVAVRHGRFAQAAQITALPRQAGPQAQSFLDGVSCLTPRDCVAVGAITQASGATVPATMDLIAGRWRHAKAARQPANGAGSESDGLYAVSCPARTSCTAVGGYADLAGYWFRADAVTIR